MKGPEKGPAKTRGYRDRRTIERLRLLCCTASTSRRPDVDVLRFATSDVVRLRRGSAPVGLCGWIQGKKRHTVDEEHPKASIMGRKFKSCVVHLGKTPHVRFLTDSLQIGLVTSTRNESAHRSAAKVKWRP